MVSGRGTRVLVDANILFSRTLRDWLALLYIQPGNEMFEVLWTDDIMVEFHYHLRKKYPLLGDDQIGGLRRRLEATFGAGRVAGYVIDDSVTYPDVGDAHVHCAAVHADADIVLTENIKHFSGMDDLPYEVYTADEFFELVDDSAPHLVRAVALEQLVYYVQKSSASRVSLPERLKTAGAPAFAERVRVHLQTIEIGSLATKLT